MKAFKVVLLFLIGSAILLSDIRIPKPLYKSGFELVNGKPGYNSEFTLRLWVKAFYDAPQSEIRVIPGNHHIHLLSGDSLIQISLSKDDSVNLDFTFKISRVGFYTISAITRDPSQDFWPSYANYYIAAFYDTSFYADTLVGDYPYNIEIDTTLIAEFLDSLESWGGLEGNLFADVRLYGQVRYYNKDMEVYEPVPNIELDLKVGFLYGGITMGNFYTDENGNFDVTWELPPNIYTLYVISKTHDGKVFGVPLPAYWILDGVKQFGVFFQDKEVEFYPEIKNGDYRGADIVKILLNVKEVKQWALNTFGITRDFVKIVYPVPQWLKNLLGTTCYIPKTYYWPGSGVTLYADKIYVFDPDEDIWGIEGKMTIAHEWGHAFTAELSNHILPGGAGATEDHWLSKVTNPGFAVAEGTAEFIEYASTIDEFVSWNDMPYENFYSNYDCDTLDNDNIICGYYPYYIDDFPVIAPNTYGQRVEGSVMQFLYDLWDSKNTPDLTHVCHF